MNTRDKPAALPAGASASRVDPAAGPSEHKAEIMSRALFIVDPQYDFIRGSLAVPKADMAMDALAAYIRENDGQYALKLITCDLHPPDHCSFRQYGGPWPPHCVDQTPGAEVWPAILKAVRQTVGSVSYLGKGKNRSCEEYSIFAANAERIRDLVASNDIDAIDICGIAGDICVLATLKDGLGAFPGQRFRVLPDFCPSLDGGRELFKFCQQTGVRCGPL